MPDEKPTGDVDEKSVEAEGQGTIELDSDADTYPTVLLEQEVGRAKAETAGDDKGDGDKADDKKTPEFDLASHPEFKIFNERLSAAERRYEAAEAKLEGLMAGGLLDRGGKDSEEDIEFKNMADMTTEEIRDWFEDDPHAYNANLLKQAKYEIMQDISGQQLQGKSQESLSNFVKEHPDIERYYKDGSIGRLLARDPNHNVISAYYELSQDDRINKAIDAKVKEITKKHEKEKKDEYERGRSDAGAFSHARVLNQGPSRHPGSYRPDGIKSEDYGGDGTSALHARFRERQRRREHAA